MKFCIECEVQAGRTIEQILRNTYRMSRALITSLKRYPDGILVNGEKRYVNHIMQEGETLTVTITEAGSTNIEPALIPLDILYEDEWMIAVSKPAHMAVHVSAGNRHSTLSNGVLYYLNRGGEEHTFHVATRLDKNTSGVVLIAKCGYVHDLLSVLLREGKIEKEYIALVEGAPPESGCIDAAIARESESIIKRCVRQDGDAAYTEYRVQEYGDGFSLVRLYPKTGRTHQLRVHMSHIGHPIAGDTMYGAAHLSQNRQLLHCRQLAFTHPVTHKNLVICKNEPSYFRQYLHKK